MRRAAGAGIAFFVATCLVLASGVPPASAAPTLRFTDGSVVVLNASNGTQRWAVKGDGQTYYQLGALGPSVVVANVGRCSRSDDGLVGSHVVAFDADTGERRWESKIRGSVDSAIFGEGVASGIVVVRDSERQAISGLSVRDGHRVWTINAALIGATTDTVFTQQANVAEIDAYDRATAKLQWSHTFETGGVSPFIQQTVVASNRDVTILANGGFAGGSTPAGGTFQPFAPTTLTAVDTRSGVERSHAVAAAPYLTGAKGVLGTGVLAYIDGKELVGLDLSSGAARWQVPLPDAGGSGAPPGVALPPGSFYAGDGGHVAIFSAALSSDTAAIDVQTGATLWTQPAIVLRSPGKSARTPALVFRSGTGENHEVEALDPTTGKKRWTISIHASYALPEATIDRNNVALSLACGTP